MKEYRGESGSHLLIDPTTKFHSHNSIIVTKCYAEIILKAILIQICINWDFTELFMLTA